ncbi:MAG: thioredoxin domain-containing protein [Myxococcota bacterium]|nr:thioredoxin domain-containing protein [Myxococcota bacterium]
MANRLAGESSPYLQQHAHNPVDWYPWGSEALEKANRENRPIFLSIGYSACHWCHVMERESFENEAIARMMNDWFVNVKVDREERPDLDQIYQLVVQLMGRSGGWPLTVFLTPEQKPYFGGTYFPPTDRHGMPGLPRVMQAVRDAYTARRDEVFAHSTEVTKAIEEVLAGRANETHGPSPHFLADSASKLVTRFDEKHGGFGVRPKFPGTMSLDVLLRAGDHERVRKSLDAMRAGGIYDQLGGGFHRYSTDERWLVPHFEKMLYDNALLLRLYADGWRAMRNARYAETASAIAAYVAREMTSPEGGFYATQDADSEGEEGRFFVWTPGQVDEACAHDEEAASAAKYVYGVTDEGNFEATGATVLSLANPPRDTREEAGLERARRAMFEAREKRPKPSRDEKILASSCALMISALANAAGVVGPSLASAAERAMRFIEGSLVFRDKNSRLARVERHCKDGVVKGPGFLDDHAFVGDAALDVYEVTGDPHWVELARALADAVLQHFRDPTDGTFFFAADDGEKILVRAKERHDHAVPSGASVACRLLLRLGTLADPKYAEAGSRAVGRLCSEVVQNPFGMSSAIGLVDRLARGSVDVVLVGPRSSEATQALAREAFRAYLPDRIIAWADPADPRSLEACAAIAEGKPARPEPVAYVCRGRACSLPIADPTQLAALLVSPPPPG